MTNGLTAAYAVYPPGWVQDTQFIHEVAARGHYPAIAVPGNRRRLVRLLLDAGGIKSPVLAFEEIGTRHKPAFVGVA